MQTISKNTLVHYSIDGTKFGPVYQDELKDLYDRGIIKLETKVWWQGLENWIEYRIIFNQNYRASNVNPPPLTGNDINNTVVWLIAFSPILTSALAYFILGFLGLDSELLATIITIALNIWLCYIDEKKLENAGYDTEAILGSAWLIPVYLFKRAKLLVQSNSYAIVWCVMLVLSYLIGL